MAERKEPKDMSLGELVTAMIYTTIQYCDRRDTEIGIVGVYHEVFDPLREELDRREQLYSKK